jgi:hypothetical protein
LFAAQPQQTSQNSLDRLSFMVGHWTGAGTGTPGEGAGEFTFEWGLNRNILIRKSFAVYPATKDRPASRHDDLLIVFAENSKLRADYFDSENHTIHYSVAVAADGKTVECLSDAIPSAPRYRLTYARAGNENSLRLKFEIANPDKPAAFNSYIDAVLQRVR